MTHVNSNFGWFLANFDALEIDGLMMNFTNFSEQNNLNIFNLKAAKLFYGTSEIYRSEVHGTTIFQ